MASNTKEPVNHGGDISVDENILPNDEDSFMDNNVSRESFDSDIQAKLDELESQVQKNQELYMRAKAEADNARRRARLDVENAHKFGQEKLAKELLDVVDSLEKGLESASQGSESQEVVSIREGIELTYKLMLDTLAKHGIEVIDPIGHEFDPKQHEALIMQENTGAEPNHIINVVQKGFIIHSRVLRHAKVIVAK